MTSYHEHTLAVIRNADILPADELQLLYRLAPEMEDTWQKRQVWRTDTEARVSVLNDLKHPTNASKYWQAVREQAVFVDQLVHLCYDYEAKQTERDALRAEAEELEEEAAATDRASTRRKLEAQARGKRIEANRCDYILLDMKLAAHHRLREIRMCRRSRRNWMMGPSIPPIRTPISWNLIAFNSPKKPTLHCVLMPVPPNYATWSVNILPPSARATFACDTCRLQKASIKCPVHGTAEAICRRH